MSCYRFRLVNVFAETRLGGNPLAVFEDGRGLGDWLSPSSWTLYQRDCIGRGEVEPGTER